MITLLEQQIQEIFFLSWPLSATSGTYVMHSIIGQTGSEFTHKGTGLHSKVIVRYHAASLVWLFAGRAIKQTQALLQTDQDTQRNVFSVWTGSPMAAGYCHSVDVSLRAMRGGAALDVSNVALVLFVFILQVFWSASSSPLTFQLSSPTPPFSPPQSFKSGSHQPHFYSEHP